MGCICCCCKKDGSQVEGETPRSRRRMLNKTKVIVPTNIEIKEEYVETPDGFLLFTRCYIPKDTSKIKGMICYNHGYGAHMDLFAHDTAKELCSNRSFIVHIHEHYGHGRSDGLYLDIPYFDMLVKHCNYLHNRAKLKYSKLYNIPSNGYFLMGESMGGAIAVHQLLKSKLIPINNVNTSDNKNYQEPLIEVKDNDNYNDDGGNIDSNNYNELVSKLKWNGLILAAPMCGIKGVDMTKYIFKCTANVFENCITPCCPKTRLPKPPMMNMETQRLKILSKDGSQYAQKKLWNDNPLANNTSPRYRTSVALVNACQFVQENAKLIEIAMLVVHSKNDGITDPFVSKQFVENVSSKDKCHNMYDKGAHLIFADCMKTKVFDDIEKFIDRQLQVDITKNNNI